MKITQKVKHNTELVILSVLILTLVSLNFSYSAFFSIDSRSTVQEVSTGTLNVVASATPMAKDDLYPTNELLPTEEKSVLKFPDNNYASLNISNNGNIDANYVITLSYDTTGLTEDQIKYNLVSFDNLIIGIYDNKQNSWLNLNSDSKGSPIYNITVSQFEKVEDNVYPIFKDTINKANISESSTQATTKDFRIYVWLADNTPTTEIGKLVYLKLNVRSTPIKGQNS